MKALIREHQFLIVAALVAAAIAGAIFVAMTWGTSLTSSRP